MREILIPSYLRTFQCIGSQCEDTCCSEWNIVIDKNTFNKYEKINEGSFKNKYKQNVIKITNNQTERNYAYFKQDKGNCSFLDKDKLCMIHREIGEEYLCDICLTFPKILNKVGGNEELSLSLSCPEAARLILLQEEGIDFQYVSDIKSGYFQSEISLEKNPNFWEIRVFIIEILQFRKIPLHVRLILVGNFVKSIENIKHKQIEVKNYIIYFRNLLNNSNQLNEIVRLSDESILHWKVVLGLLDLYNKSNIYSKRYKECLKEVLNSLGVTISHEKASENYEIYEREYYKPFIKEHTYILENYLVDFVFKNLFPYNEANFHDSFSKFIMNFAVIELHLIGVAGYNKGLTKELVIKVIQSYSKTFEHNELF